MEDLPSGLDDHGRYPTQRNTVMKTRSVTFFTLLTIILSAGCGAEPMSENQRVKTLVESAYDLNEKGNHEAALKQIELAWELQPDDSDLIEQKANFLWNVEIDRSPKTCIYFANDCISRGVGSELYFRIWRARVFEVMGARWKDGSYEIIDREHCLAGIADLRRAHELDPKILSKVEQWEWLLDSWENDFGGLQTLPEYPSALRQ